MKVKVLDLKPTQFAVGMLEIDAKIEIANKFNEKELQKYIRDNVVPVVRGPDNHLYVVDKHHYLSICYHVGIEKVRVKIIEDFKKQKMTYIQFWNWMKKSRNSYPYCQFGEGPREAIYLPQDIRGLADDPYRSIAWFVRKAGAFENSDMYFAEFQWANFFRSKKLLKKYGRDGFPQALVEAVKLAQSDEARKLPGFGKLNLEERIEIQKEAKAKGQRAIKK